jgi:hypothetical protein
MSADSTASDPYRSPPIPDSSYAPSMRSGRPGWLTALCVIAIVIGILGALNGLFGAVGTLFSRQLQTAVTPAAPPGASQQMQKVQQQFQAETLAIQDKYFVGILLSAIVRTIVAGALTWGGVSCLSLKQAGRTLLLAACAAAILFEIGNSVLQGLVSMEMMAAMNGFFENFLQTMPQGSGPPPELFLKFLKGWMIFGLVMGYVIVGLKIAFYIFGLIYLQREAVKTLFEPSLQATFPAAT